jgi:hypothetical protein
MEDKTRFFSEHDRRLLEATSKSTWAPPEPRKLIEPFLPEEEKTEETDLERRLRKSIEVLEGYQRLEARCRELRAEISERCKDVAIPIDPKKDRAILLAARRIFKRDVREITFEMYKEIVHGMAKMGNNLVPEAARGRRLV